jgi:hypothetical protein
MKKIDMGRDRYNKPVFFFESLNYGVNIILAKPRYGKSVLVKNLYTQIAEYRPVIILDYIGEHSGTKWPNFRSRHKTACIPDLHTIKDFAFLITDFDQIDDWVSMGFTERSAPILFELLKFGNIHNNDPAIFFDLLTKLPTKEIQIPAFNAEFGEYGLSVQTPFNTAIKTSLVSYFSNVWNSGLIMSQEEADSGYGKTYIENWGDYALSHPHLNINLNLVTSGNVKLARASIGKILDQLVSYLPMIRPLIVVEEADFIAPNIDDSSKITSLYQLRNYVLKHQRTGVELMFITQDPNNLDQSIITSGTTFIMGNHAPCSSTSAILDEPHLNYSKDVIHKLRFDRYKNIREFAIMQAGNGGRYQIFQPNDSCTLL